MVERNFDREASSMGVLAGTTVLGLVWPMAIVGRVWSLEEAFRFWILKMKWRPPKGYLLTT